MTDRNDRADLAALAHDLDAPELLDWWGSKVIWDNVGGFGVDVGGGYVFPRESAHVCEPEHFDHDETVVTVVVDRDGRLPAAEGYRQDALTEIRNRRTVEAERDEARAALAEARADLAAFRAEVATLRNDVYNLFDYEIEERLSAILDGEDR